ncbi:L-galactono-1 4-lactone dehydrogenase mitochondrial-like isoform X1 [Tripterygium wilfordii]|uniref:L-galactono-1 4-lactone dehydrogenase mitochondrial-like isoform X1 n=1 Tax=Tripterygium wilfordii TaxID=458696 RepID=A0A7J7DNS7_TRIWF|nr:L-galactono-1,4-lactone dehydrogenase, mitochondrial-like [Tripterygium wilfordii]XP_038701591.1 L-galactono-1,4-lactone dehydrogenase, mitochondrial-like [Tripterygium wilfordii]XP_038701592.1 L-galactono-1,4-lactone dehydrogenase, mitochondrial-like [Tripterygium wilfordii]KAF5747957.1 L-galactono-1 4-lactone dehydrogenase mitochondrial-like isoform X1 [Tripterygium wilfordii]
MLRTLTLRRSLRSFHHRQTPTSSCTATSGFPANSNGTRFLPNSNRTFCTSPAPSSSTEAKVRQYLGYGALMIFSGAATYYYFPEDALQKKAKLFRYAPMPDDLHTVSNWSGTHEVLTREFHQPENLAELEKLVKESNEKKAKIRPVGSGLSPNGIGLARAGMVNLALMDKVLEVDKEKKRVRVQAGIRVQQLVDGIKDYGLTLQNFASIREQQIGGIVQVGAHGTGARLPPIDEQVVSMKLVTPAKGTIEISKENNPELFYLARVGLGGLGVVAEVTLQCVDRQELVEHTVVSSMKELKKNHRKLLSENKHVKYLYIPYTDSVVIVTCNPVSKWRGPPKFKPKYTEDEALEHVRGLYRESLRKYRAREISAQPSENTEPDIDQLSFTELRDKLLALDPLNKDHVIKINQAEAEFWRKSEGYRVGWSDEILGFDCGGQQWVSEICFPAGTLRKPSMMDLEYIEELKELIEKEDIPAPAPIEQRWTARSQSRMSLSSSPAEDDIFSWVGIIMYLPTMDARQRKDITEEFFHYRHLTQSRLWDRYSAYEHWAKIEVPKDNEELAALQARLRKRFPVDEYNKARKELDPSRILSNHILEKLFPLSDNI